MAYSSLANWDGRASSSRHSSPSPHTSADDSNPSLAAQAAQSGPSTSAVSAERVSKLRPGEDRTSSFDMPPSPTTNEERAVPVSGSPERAVDKMLFLPESASEPEPVQAGIALPAQEVDTRVAGSEVTDHLVQTAVKSRPSTPPTAQSSTPLLDMQVPSEPSSKGSTAVDPEPLQSTLEVPLSAIPSDVNSNTTALSNSKTNSASSTAPPAGSLVVSTDAPSGSSKYIDATRTESSPGIHDSTPAQDADVEMADITTDAPDRQSQDMPSDSGSSRSRRRAVPRIAAAAVLNALASPQAGPSSDQLGVRSSGPPPRLGNLGPSESFTSFTSFTRLASRGSSTSSHGIKRTFFESPSPGSTSRDSTAPPPRKQQKQRHAYEAEAGPSTLYRSISPPPFQTRSTHRSLHGGTKNRQLCYVNVPPFPQGVSREEYFPMELYVPIEVNGGKTPKRKAKERAEQTIKVVASLDLAAELQLQAGPPPPDSSKRKRPMKKDTSVARNSSEVRTAQPPPQPRKRADPKGKEKAVSRMSELRATTQLPEPPNSVRYPSLPATPPPPDPYHDKYANFAPPNANTAIVPADGFAPLEIAGVEVDYPDELPLTSLLLCASLRHIAPGRSADWWRRRAREEEEVMKLWREQVEREKQKLMTPFGPGPQIGWASSSASASASTSKKVKAEPSTSKANMNASASSARRKREAKGKAALRKQAGASASGGVPPPQPSLPPPSLPPQSVRSPPPYYGPSYDVPIVMGYPPPLLPPPPPAPPGYVGLPHAHALPPSMLQNNLADPLSLSAPMRVQIQRRESVAPREEGRDLEAFFISFDEHARGREQRQGGKQGGAAMGLPFGGPEEESGPMELSFREDGEASGSGEIDSLSRERERGDASTGTTFETREAANGMIAMPFGGPERGDAEVGISFAEQAAGTVGMQFLELGDGTIDPTLLGAPLPLPEPEPERSRSPSERQSSTLERTRSPSEPVQEGTNGPSSDEQTLAATEDPRDSDYEEKPSKGKGKGKGKATAIGKVKIAEVDDGEYEVPVEVTFCHHCRRTTPIPKMRCTLLKHDGEPCGKRFCINCIVKKYPKIQFNDYATMFRCPYCEQTCTCTACCQKRGETYVPMPRYQIDYETLEPIIRGKPKATPKAAKSKREPRPSTTSARPRRKSPSPQPLPENHADQLTSGLFWGSVYGIDGARLGGAYINADKQAVVLKPLAALAAVPPRAPKRRVFIGKPDPSWGAGTQGKDVEAGYEPVPPWRRAYIGKRRILAGGWSSESDSEDVDEKFGSDPFDGPLSPVPDEADEDVMDAPPEMPPAHELSFVIAKALFNTSPSPWGNNEV